MAPSGRDVHRGGTEAMSVLLIIVGLALIVRTVIEGGGVGALGIVFGVLFTIAGALRLWVARRTR